MRFSESFLIGFLQIVAFLVVSAESLSMMGGGSTTKTSSILFVTNKMCPFAQKAWIALEASQVPYQFEQISLYGAGGKPNWFRKLNPKGTVPVVVVNNGDKAKEVVLADSDLILDEIDMVVHSLESSSKASSDLLTAPEDAATIAKIQAFRSALNAFLPVGKSAILGGDKGRMWSELRKLDALMDGSSSFLAGTQQPTVADCAGFPFLWRIDNEFGKSAWSANGCENIPVWLELCEQQPAFRKSVQSSWWWWW